MITATQSAEEVLNFECCGSRLWGIVHRTGEAATRGIVMVVGGPQIPRFADPTSGWGRARRGPTTHGKG